MENNIYKCSSPEHKEINAIKFCEECKIYICNKCDKFHSGLFSTHKAISLDKNSKDIFTDLCKNENHNIKLEYFCKDHNELCCAYCITKIKSKGKGQHSECNICNIEDISDEKAKNLEKNMKSLKELYKSFESSMMELNEIIEKINENKDEIKLNIQKTFTKIRNELNNRENELLLEVDEQFNKKIMNNDLNLLKDRSKLSNKMKCCLEKEKSLRDEMTTDSKNKPSFINECINIEKIINSINNLNQDMEKLNRNMKKIQFVSSEKEIIELIKRYGSIISGKNKEENYSHQEINVSLNDYHPGNLKCIQNICNNCGYGGNCYVYDGICFFISKKDEHVLGYSDANSGSKSIIFYDVNNKNEIKRINNAHNNSIHIIKYYDYSLYDLILSSSCNDDIKLWNYNDCLNIMTISQIFNDSGNGVFSSCIILEKNISYILCVGYYNYIKVYNGIGEHYKNLGQDSEDRRFIDICDLDNRKYIISGGNKGITVYNYPNFDEYYRFLEKNDSTFHNYAKILKANKIYNLIDVGFFNKIKIWDFFGKKLLFCIASNNNYGLEGFITINNRYLILGAENGDIKEFDIEKRILIKCFEEKHTSNVLGIKIIKDKNEKIFLISYGMDQNIFLWEV